jgi:hypothetical protein
MKSAKLAAAALLSLTALSAFAQNASMDSRPDRPAVNDSDSREPRSNRASNISAADTRSNVAPALPSPKIGDDAAPRDYLRAARDALAAGHTGEAQQSLEMAETRLLDRSVDPADAASPDNDDLVSRIKEALLALGDGDRSHAIQVVDSALGN